MNGKRLFFKKIHFYAFKSLKYIYEEIPSSTVGNILKQIYLTGFNQNKI